jgi:hypothetical protein
VSSPLGLTQATAAATSNPSDIRRGEVIAVTSRGVDVAIGAGMVEGAAHLTSYNPAVGDTVAMISYANSWVVVGRAVGPGTAADYSVPGTGLGSTILDGCVLTASNTDLATSTGSQVAVPRLGLTYYHPPSHWVLLMLNYSWYSSVANDVMTTRVVEAGGTAYSFDNTQQVAGVGNFSTVAVLADQSLGGLKRSWLLTIQRVSGSGTVRMYDPGTRKGSWVAYDLGAASIIRTV